MHDEIGAVEGGHVSVHRNAAAYFPAAGFTHDSARSVTLHGGMGEGSWEVPIPAVFVGLRLGQFSLRSGVQGFGDLGEIGGETKDELARSAHLDWCYR
jgi:hypothetical protein